MSLAEDKRVHTRTVIKLKDQATLILSKELLLQIHYMHHRVNNGIEWSGILIYNTVEGSVKDPSTWVIKAEEFLPMDVGTSGYTEYEIDPSDEFAFDRWTSALVDGKKLGHIHTHHNMTTFFSGVDMSELHDNAPNHNYYLSLIVNCKEPNVWCAKVAICGEIKQEGTKRVSGSIKTTKVWAGISEQEEEVVEEDLTADEEINTTMEVLYTIDCNIEIDPAFAPFQERVTEVTKPKTVVTNYATGGYLSRETGVGKVFKDPNPGIQTRIWKDWKEEFVEEHDGETYYPDNAFTPGKVKSFLESILSLTSSTHLNLEQSMLKLVAIQDPAAKILLDKQEDNFEIVAKSHFKGLLLDYRAYHCIAVSIMDLLQPYEHIEFVDKFLNDILEVYLLPTSMIDPTFTKRVTGLDFIWEEEIEFN